MAKREPNKAAWPDILKKAKKGYQLGFDREQNNMDQAYSDLKFRRGELKDQWGDEALNARKNRPCLVMNFLPKFIRQVTGDMRQMRPSAKFVPVDSRGDIKTAEIQGGMFRYIENRSYAKHVYTTAADSQVACGIAHWRVATEFAHQGTFNQEIRILGIQDGVAVIWDVNSEMPTREDAEECWVPVDMARDSFKAKWPDASAEDFGDNLSGAFESWQGTDYIRVAEYWVKKPIKRTLARYPDGTVDDLTDTIANSDEEAVKEGMAFIQAQQGAQIEERDSYKICRYLMTASEILEEEDWPGMHIPIVPVLGEEIRIGREVYRHGVVRYARDPQRMANYYASAEAEVVGLQPKAPWLGTKKQFEKHYDQWETANAENHPFLEYTPDPAAGGPPQRVLPPVASQAIQAGRLQSMQDIQEVIGIYNASLGQKSNETSGKAINARDRQSDTGTFVYIDNFSLAIQRTAQIVGDLFPHIYDTQRMIRIVGLDGKESLVEINKPIMEGGLSKVENDVTVGAYDVTIEPGPGYATRREEAREGMAQFIQSSPDVAPLIGDLYAKSQDWPMAEEIGERLEYALPAPVKAKIDMERQKNRSPNEPPEEQPPPSQAEMMSQKAAEIELAGKAAEVKKTEAETAKILKDVQAPPEGAQGADPSAIITAHHEAAMNQVKLAAAQDDLETQRQLNAIKIQKALADLHNAETGIVAGREKHALDMAGKVENLVQGAEKHEAGMAQQITGMRQGEEAHSVKLERMQQPERADA